MNEIELKITAIEDILPPEAKELVESMENQIEALLKKAESVRHSYGIYEIRENIVNIQKMRASILMEFMKLQTRPLVIGFPCQHFAKRCKKVVAMEMPKMKTHPPVLAPLQQSHSD